MKRQQALETNNRMTLRYPAPVLGLLLAFWGYCNDLLAIALIFAAIIEGLKFLPIRWDLDAPHFQRVADLTSVLFAVIVVYQFIEYAFHGIYGVLSLLPVCLLPLLLAERISTIGLLPLSSLFISLRRQIARGQAEEIWVSSEFIYGMSCIFAASANDLPPNAYFLSATAFFLLLLFSARANRISRLQWAFTISAALVLAFAIQLGMQAAYRYAEGGLSYWFNQFTWGQTNPVKTRTAIGHIGRLKLSDRIQVRVKAPLSIPLPLYLHEASYNEFNLGAWSAPETKPAVVDPLPQSQHWAISDPGESTPYRIEITSLHKKDLGVQPLPVGTTRVTGTEIIELQRNALGTTLLEAIPGQLRYRADYLGNTGEHNRLDRADPDESDRAVPDAYASVIDSVRGEIATDSDEPMTTIAAVKQFFRDNFPLFVNR